MFVVVIWITDWLSGLIVLAHAAGRRGVPGAHRPGHRAPQPAPVAQPASGSRTTSSTWSTGCRRCACSGGRAAQQRSIAAVTDEYRRTTMGVLRVSFLSSFVLELAASLSVALVAVQIGLRLLGGDLELGRGPAVLLLAPDVYLPLRQLGAAHHAAEEGRAATSGVLDVLDLPAPPVGRRSGSRRWPATGWTSAGVTGPQVGPGRPGAGLAGAGPRRAGGAGRSERGRQVDAAGRAARLRPARCGNGPGGRVDLADADPERWRAQIAWVPQRRRAAARLASPTTSRSARDDADRRRGARALELAAADDIDPQRMLGEDGAGLSAGERQRIALATGIPAGGAGRGPAPARRAHRPPGRPDPRPRARRSAPGRGGPLRAAGRARPRRWPPPPTGSCGSTHTRRLHDQASRARRRGTSQALRWRWPP